MQGFVLGFGYYVVIYPYYFLLLVLLCTGATGMYGFVLGFRYSWSFVVFIYYF
jgi:hypothetical protein